MILVEQRNITNPYFNLALEEYLVRNADCSLNDYLLLYINGPCIVLGKNQSVYKEVNFEVLRTGSLPIARRITGGGTVYHDEGNLNFAFISGFEEKKINNYLWFNQKLIDAFAKVDIKVEPDGRNNLVHNGKKISGNAQFTNRKNIISHGTLLFSANLDRLRAALKPNDFEVETKAPRSVPGSVANLGEVSTVFESVEEMKTYLTDELCDGEIDQLSETNLAEVERMAREKFETYDWIYGRSPVTGISKSDCFLEIEEGIIRKVDGNLPQKLVGLKYYYPIIADEVKNWPDGASILNLIF